MEHDIGFLLCYFHGPRSSCDGYCFRCRQGVQLERHDSCQTMAVGPDPLLSVNARVVEGVPSSQHPLMEQSELLI